MCYFLPDICATNVDKSFVECFWEEFELIYEGLAHNRAELVVLISPFTSELG